MLTACLVGLYGSEGCRGHNRCLSDGLLCQAEKRAVSDDGEETKELKKRFMGCMPREYRSPVSLLEAVSPVRAALSIQPGTLTASHLHHRLPRRPLPRRPEIVLGLHQPTHLIVTPSDQHRLCGAERHTVHCAVVPSEPPDRSPRGHVPIKHLQARDQVKSKRVKLELPHLWAAELVAPHVDGATRLGVADATPASPYDSPSMWSELGMASTQQATPIERNRTTATRSLP